MLVEWKSRTRLTMSRTDHDWSKVTSPFTELMRSRSLMGLPSPWLPPPTPTPGGTRVATDAGEVAQPLLGPVEGVGARGARCVVLEVAGPDDLEGLGPVRCTHAAARTFSPDSWSKTDIGNDMLMPFSASTTFANWSKLSETACWMGIPKSSSMGRHQLAHALIERRIDLVRPVASGIRDEQVARDRQERQPVMCRVGRGGS